MLFTLIFLGGLLVGWSLCAYFPWLVVSVATRGEAGLGMLALCLFAGVAGALAVPLLGADGSTGLWVSFVVAAAAPALLLTLRRITLPVYSPRIATNIEDDQS